jgi:predicted CoA-binding protein
MPGIAELIRDSRTVVLIDWPDREVPDSLARAGYNVVSWDGATPEEINAYELVDGSVTVRRTDPPAAADLVYAHRPLDELDAIIERARSLGAKAIWLQSGRDATGAPDRRGTWLPEDESRGARSTVESAGLAYVDSPYIVDAVLAVKGGAGGGGGEA